mgnify:CR=1 FL=1
MKTEYVIASLVAVVFILNLLTSTPAHASEYQTCVIVGNIVTCITL